MLSRDLLVEHVWASEFPSKHRTIDVHIRWLCEKKDRTGPCKPRAYSNGAGRRLSFQKRSIGCYSKLCAVLEAGRLS